MASLFLNILLPKRNPVVNIALTAVNSRCFNFIRYPSCQLKSCLNSFHQRCQAFKTNTWNNLSATNNFLKRKNSFSWNKNVISFCSLWTVHAVIDLKNPPEKLNLQKLDPKNLKYSFLIGQSVALTVDSATNVLTQTTLAVLDADENYRRELTKLIKLLEQHLVAIGKNYDDDKEWDRIVAARSESEAKKRLLNDLEIYIQSVVNLLTKASEVAYLADCDYVSVAANERVQSALNSIELSKEKTLQLEAEYLKLYSKIITETGKTKPGMNLNIPPDLLHTVI